MAAKAELKRKNVEKAQVNHFNACIDALSGDGDARGPARVTPGVLFFTHLDASPVVAALFPLDVSQWMLLRHGHTYERSR